MKFHVTATELNPRRLPLAGERLANFCHLFYAVNVLREAFGKPFYINSGVRTEADQARINPKAPKSNHIEAAACDVADRDGELWAFLTDPTNLRLLEELGVYLEAREATPQWVHLQIKPPRSGKRIFLP